MTERDWEADARRRLERVVAQIVNKVRDSADNIEREARITITSAAKSNRDLEFQTYNRVAAQITHEVHTLLANLYLDNLINSAGDAEKARYEKGQKS